MRVVPLLVVLLLGLSMSSAPEISTVAAPTSVAAGAAGEADYQALQIAADVARDALAQAQGRRVAMAQLAAD